MRVDERRVGDVTVLVAVGDPDVVTLPVLESRLNAVIRDGGRAIVVDLSGVRLLPSTATGVLLTAAQRLRGLGGRLVLCGVRPGVRGTLATMGVAGVLRGFEDAEAAVRSFSGPGG